jgi:hypothetical protein
MVGHGNHIAMSVPRLIVLTWQNHHAGTIGANPVDCYISFCSPLPVSCLFYMAKKGLIMPWKGAEKCMHSHVISSGRNCFSGLYTVFCLFATNSSIVHQPLVSVFFSPLHLHNECRIPKWRNPSFFAVQHQKSTTVKEVFLIDFII